MSEEKEYTKRTLVTTEEETSDHKKKSKTSSKSNSDRRSNHKHDYEPVIIEEEHSRKEYHWAKRCKICGRVDDRGWFKDDSKKDLIKRKETIKFQSGDTFTFDIFYSFRELQKLFPGASIIKCTNYGRGEYEEVKEGRA